MDGMTDTAPPRASSVVDSPMDLIHYSIDDQILLKCKFGREIRGKLHAFDEHLNVLLGDVEEKITTIEVNPETLEETTKVENRTFELLFVRGDLIIMFSNPFRTG
eukprot:TRINITY_DN106822_c0_g1_i1.p1 TRINITY_DN106822_c0_g1~~TRINITY_DN106822_c0_g1_i1.p1  ORF type:complete len:105 (-),score=8.04 TRINITY_DN106822_c0_g1_i1:84-398(-)